MRAIGKGEIELKAFEFAKPSTITRKRGKIYWVPYLFLLPAIVLLFTFDYLPTIMAFVYSFFEYHVIAPPKWTGLANYRELAHDPIFLKSLLNSFRYMVVMLPFQLTVPLLLAIVVNQKLKGIHIFRIIYYLPVITPAVAVAIVWKFLYHPNGVFNALLKEIGLMDKPISWLLDLKTALPSVAAMELWKSFGFYMIIYLAGLQVISRSLVEAARIDGANALRIIWHVYLPQIRPIFAVVLIMGTLDSLRVFTSVYMMTGGGPLNSTLSLAIYIYQKAFKSLDMGYATTMGIVFWAILMVLTIINYKISRGGQTTQ